MDGLGDRRPRRRAGLGYSAAADAPAVVGGDGASRRPAVPANIKGTPLMVDGTLYVTTPDNAWAMDARDGRELWHYFWRRAAARTSPTAASACGTTSSTW